MVTMDKGQLKLRENEWVKAQNKPQQEYISPVVLSNVKYATFQAAMKVTILIGQCFGLMPFLGVCEKNTSKQRFKIYSGKFLYTLIAIIGQSSLFVLCVIKLFRGTNTVLPAVGDIIFYGSNCMTTIIFLRIAMQWPKLSQLVAKSESIDPNTDLALTRRCNISCTLILVLAVGEHLLSDISGFSMAMDCQPDTPLYDAFLLQSFPSAWTFIDYNIIWGCLFHFLTLQCTFNWNYANAFVICVSLYIISRLEEINKKIKAVRGKFVPSSFWNVIREDYSRVTNLVRQIDDVVNGIMFITFANNICSICPMLLHTLQEGFRSQHFCSKDPSSKPLNGYEQGIYHAYSLVFLLIRFMAVSLIAARVHTASKEPAQALYDVPASGYYIEVQRFLNQVHNDTVALTGLQFFNIKKGLVLTITGTIVTYELVLMQFSGVTLSDSPSPTTSTISP